MLVRTVFNITITFLTLNLFLQASARAIDTSPYCSPMDGQPFLDCNLNGSADHCDVSQCASSDCNSNEIPDECDLSSGRSHDTNVNGILDECLSDADGYILETPVTPQGGALGAFLSQITNNGLISGAFFYEDFTFTSFVRLTDGTIHSLPRVGPMVNINDINESGAGTGFLTLTSQDWGHAFSWSTTAQSMEPLNLFLPPSHHALPTNARPTSNGTAINNNNVIVGNSGYEWGTGAATRPVKLENGIITEVVLPPNSLQNYAYLSAINDNGLIVGSFDKRLPNGSVRTLPFISDGTNAVQLPTLGGDFGAASDINEAGDIVGISELSIRDRFHAFYKPNGGAIVNLGAFPGAEPYSQAAAINNRREVVGFSDIRPFYPHGFISRNGGPLIDLNRLVRNNCGYEIMDARDINDRGEILASGITPDGGYSGFLLKPVRNNVRRR